MSVVDARHPTCGRCEKGGFQCQGYRRPLRFINSTGQSAKNNLLPRKGGIIRGPSTPEDMKGQADNHNVGNTTFSRPTIDNSCSLDTSPLGRSLQSCLRIWPSNDIVFTTSYAYVDITTTAVGDNTGTHLSSSAPFIGSRVWAQLHGDAAKHVQIFLYNLLVAQGMGLGVLESRQWNRGSMQPSALELSVEAAAWALHGRLTKHTVNVQQAITQFNPITHSHVTILTVVMNMALFEMLLHMDEARRTYLEEPCWQNIPWSEYPDQKSFANRFIDVVCCIPGILEDEKRRIKMQQEYMSTGTTWSHDLYESLRQRVILLYLKLLSIRWEWELQHPSCCFEIFQESRTKAGGVLSVNEATGQPIFNSVGLGIMDELKEHQASLSSFSYKTNSPLTFPHETEPDRNAVRDICRSVEFLLQPTHGPAGGYVLMFPLRVAQIYHDIRLPSRDYSKEKWNDVNTSMSNDYSNESDVHIVETQPGMGVDQSVVDHGGFSGRGDQNERVRMDRPRKENTVLEAENSTSTKFGQCAIISEWIQKVMRYISDVHGFIISKSYTS
ncbi:uncharacterized protein Triagg1_10611 [Trichoderma aggressivum f. europaeum]|uniref:Zn(2)-C6 fungal-type domain-containing protein n=1 Tax=Trichoderma aggressivum f. europaeum TaxID=173218 RepID=A0AAE1I553_9HYPO|nr:hypothetical protein Triagg1_10611 [Trichoderma aggressivum f. europaeum]